MNSQEQFISELARIVTTTDKSGKLKSVTPDELQKILDQNNLIHDFEEVMNE